jgi:hypothetical protein
VLAQIYLTLAGAVRAGGEGAAQFLEEAAADLSSEQPDLIDQHASPFGPRVHCRIVRERMARHEDGALILHRRHCLTPAALGEELARLAGTREPAAPTETKGAGAELRAQLGLVAGGRR